MAARRDPAARRRARRRGVSPSPTRWSRSGAPTRTGTRRPSAARCTATRTVHRVRPGRDRRRTGIRVQHGQARRRPARLRALRRARRLRPRPAAPPADPGVLRRRGRRERDATRCCGASTRTAAPRSSRRWTVRAPTGSTSGCRVRARPCSSTTGRRDDRGRLGSAPARDRRRPRTRRTTTRCLPRWCRSRPRCCGPGRAWTPPTTTRPLVRSTLSPRTRPTSTGTRSWPAWHATASSS